MPPSAAAVYFMQDILQMVARLSGSGSGHGGGSGDQQGPCHNGDSHQVHDYHHEGGGVGNLDSVVCNGSTHIQIVVNMGSSGGGSGNDGSNDLPPPQPQPGPHPPKTKKRKQTEGIMVEETEVSFRAQESSSSDSNSYSASLRRRCFPNLQGAHLPLDLDN